MKVSEIIGKLDLCVLTKADYEDKEVANCYIGDLLSHVMGKAQPDDLWITIMNNINIVAVAALCDVAAILLCEGVSVPDEVLKKADGEGIIILKSELSAYELAGKLREIL